MLLIIRSAKPSLIREFLDNNEGSQYWTGYAPQSLMEYQRANGGTGYGFAEVQKSWLAALGYDSLDDIFDSYEIPNGLPQERLRTFLTTVTITPPVEADPVFLLLESDDILLLENDDKLRLEG
jgi:hypothetical protein